ncbi:MAG: hypothetical protein ABIF82_04045 [Planctomycetota bacterium]
MRHDEAIERIQEIHRIAERTTLYTLLPGVPAIAGGLLVLAGCVVSYAMIRSLDFQEVLSLSMGAQIGFCAMWTAIGVIAVAYHIVWTAAAARRQGLSPAARPGRFSALALSPSVLVALVLTAKFLADEQVQYIAPVWMMCYGTGVYAAGLFSVRLPRLLGLAMLMAGMFALLCTEYGLPLTVLSFGVLHILFGLAVVRTTRRETQQ